MMFGYGHGGYLMVRTIPSADVEDDDDGCHARSCRSCRRRRGDVLRQAHGLDESDQQGPNRALAEVVAHPLRIQPSIDNHCRLLHQIGQLLGYLQL
jgi:hypothetical protein